MAGDPGDLHDRAGREQDGERQPDGALSALLPGPPSPSTAPPLSQAEDGRGEKEERRGGDGPTPRAGPEAARVLARACALADSAAVG